jgi:hypothetical protein
MSYPHIIEPLLALPKNDLRELVIVTLYRLSIYAVINLVDDAAMLSLIFV